MWDKPGHIGCPHVDSHPEGWARLGTTLKRVLRVLQHSAVSGPRFSVGAKTGTLVSLCFVSTFSPVGLSAQSLDPLAIRFASMTAVTGLEQAMTDSLLALLPGSTRDRAGNVTLTLGQGAPKRLLQCPLDEVGYVVGNITADGRSEERRVGEEGRSRGSPYHLKKKT